MRVDEDLRDALADVLEDAVARVLVAERVIALVAVHGPDLKWDQDMSHSRCSHVSSSSRVQKRITFHKPCQAHLNIAGHGAGDEELLVGVDGDALDRLLVGAEKVHLALLTQVPHGDLKRRRHREAEVKG